MDRTTTHNGVTESIAFRFSEAVQEVGVTECGALRSQQEVPDVKFAKGGAGGADAPFPNGTTRGDGWRNRLPVLLSSESHETDNRFACQTEHRDPIDTVSRLIAV